MTQRRLLWVTLWLASTAFILAGCATPLDIGAADRRITPREAADRPAQVNARTVAWGGTIVNGKNLADNTQLEVVAYALDGQNRPQPDTAPTGRFIVIHRGYLETADYAPGRLITVVGTMTETRSGKVGEAHVVYPVIAASRLHLWPRETQNQNEPRFHFSIGIGIIR
jgi:outer membrane lipoprotein